MMQFDWTTFILEMLNFLVLVWILQRLIYRPVLAMLDARQQRLKDESGRAELSIRAVFLGFYLPRRLWLKRAARLGSGNQCRVASHPWVPNNRP